MYAVIVEDEPNNLARLESMLRKSGRQLDIVARLTSYTDALEWFQDNTPPDVVFLDIQLGDGTAFDLLKKITPNFPIIFTTAYDEYAISAFEFNSIDYLLKPFSQEKLEKALQKLEKSIELMPRITPSIIQQVEQQIIHQWKQRFLIRVGEKFYPLEIPDISYFQFKNGLVRVHTFQGKTLPMEHTLEQVEKQLNPELFFRLNRQFIISMPAIIEIHTYFNGRLLLNLKPNCPDQVIVSRERVQDFKKWMDR